MRTTFFEFPVMGSLYRVPITEHTYIIRSRNILMGFGKKMHRPALMIGASAPY